MMMKHLKYVGRIFTLAIVLSGYSVASIAQISIGLNGDSPHPSAMLDIQSAERGLLTPRMSSSDRLAIESPAEGLIVYDLTLQSFYYYSSGWQPFSERDSSTAFTLVSNSNCYFDTLVLSIDSAMVDSISLRDPLGVDIPIAFGQTVITSDFATGLYSIMSYHGDIVTTQKYWLSFRDCSPSAHDDYLLVTEQQNEFNILLNDQSTGPLFLTHLDGFEVQESSSIVDNSGSYIITVGDVNGSITVHTTSDEQAYTQLQYSVQDKLGNTSTGTITLHHISSPAYDTLSKTELIDLISSVSPGEPVDLQGKLYIVQGSPLTINAEVYFRNGTFKRACTGVASSLDTLMAGSTQVVVDDPSDFKVGDWILAVSGQAVGQNSSGQILAIKSIIDDTITTFQPHVKAMSAGATIVHQFPMLRTNQGTGSPVTFEGIVFDGNKQCNDYTYDWRYNPTITIEEMDSIRNCTFINMPCENVFMHGGVLENSFAYDLNGSFVHGSCQAGSSQVSIVTSNQTNRVCRIPQPINGHNEGWFTYSANVQNFVVTNNYSLNGGEGCFGAQGTDDYNNTFLNNYFENFRIRKFGTSNNHPNPDDISMNTFINVPF